MKKKVIIVSIMIGFILLITGCQNETNLIGLRRLEYKPERAELYIYYFPSKAEANSYFEREGVDDYFLFEMNKTSAEDFFNNLEGESLGDNQKKLTFLEDSDETAIDKVVDMIDENNMLRVEGPN